LFVTFKRGALINPLRRRSLRPGDAAGINLMSFNNDDHEPTRPGYIVFIGLALAAIGVIAIMLHNSGIV
jgi:hypothetical protein